jgi:LacI family transcriptional regulator
VRHLIEHGHRRIAFLGDEPVLDTARLRLEGYRAALREGGIDEEIVLTCLPDTDDAVRHTESVLDSEHPPTAIFSANTRCSLGAVPVLHRRGRLDVAFVGFGDLPMADSLSPGITVIDHSAEVIGRLAAERLMNRLEEPDAAAEEVVAAVHLIARGSGEVRP